MSRLESTFVDLYLRTKQNHSCYKSQILNDSEDLQQIERGAQTIEMYISIPALKKQNGTAEQFKTTTTLN